MEFVVVVGNVGVYGFSQPLVEIVIIQRIQNTQDFIGGFIDEDSRGVGNGGGIWKGD